MSPSLAGSTVQQVSTRPPRLAVPFSAADPFTLFCSLASNSTNQALASPAALHFARLAQSSRTAPTEGRGKHRPSCSHIVRPTYLSSSFESSASATNPCFHIVYLTSHQSTVFDRLLQTATTTYCAGTALQQCMIQSVVPPVPQHANPSPVNGRGLGRVARYTPLAAPCCSHRSTVSSFNALGKRYSTP